MTKQTQTTLVEQRIEKLGSAISEMDMYAQEGFETVNALLSIVEKALTVPGTYTPKGIGDIFTVLEAAIYFCSDMGNIVNSAAESAGHHYEGGERRQACIDGFKKALEGGAA